MDTRTYMNSCDNMILRDFLALDRTILANKRTLLAYVRTSIGLLAGGIGMVKVVPDGIVNVLGCVFIAAALPVLIAGTVEYMKMRRELRDIEKMNENSQE